MVTHHPPSSMPAIIVNRLLGTRIILKHKEGDLGVANNEEKTALMEAIEIEIKNCLDAAGNYSVTEILCHLLNSCADLNSGEMDSAHHLC